MSTDVKRLEQSLLGWEENNFLQEFHNRLSQKLRLSPTFATNGSVKYWREFRSYLMSLKPFQEINLDSRFRLDSTLKEGHEMAFNNTFATALAKWTANSRRVYTLPTDLSTILSLTGFGSHTWNDVTFPFNTFAVKLEQPIIKRDHATFDTMIVSWFKGDFTNPDAPIAAELDILLVSNMYDKYTFLTEFERQQMIKQLGKGKNWLRLESEINRRMKFMVHSHLYSRFRLQFDPAEPINETFNALKNGDSTTQGYAFGDAVEGDEGQLFEIWEPALKVAIGLCIYLVANANKSKIVSKWEPVIPQEKSPKVITDQSEICRVYGKIKLSQKTIDVLNRMRNEPTGKVTPHFVSGHWRRPPYTGHDPNQIKSVQVLPYHVNGDLLGEEELTAGTETKL